MCVRCVYAVCGCGVRVRCSVCSVRCAVCGVQCAVCICGVHVRCSWAVCGVRCAVCESGICLRYAVFGVRCLVYVCGAAACTVCGVWCVCGMSVRCAVCSVGLRGGEVHLGWEIANVEHFVLAALDYL